MRRRRSGRSPCTATTRQPCATKSYQDLVVGYAQIGAESEWRIANTASMKETADELGVELKFADGQQKQENQIRALRTFIAMKLDVIGISPVVETGWEPVFREVKDGGHPADPGRSPRGRARRPVRDVSRLGLPRGRSQLGARAGADWSTATRKSSSWSGPLAPRQRTIATRAFARCSKSTRT